jgi:hypothetical protein
MVKYDAEVSYIKASGPKIFVTEFEYLLTEFWLTKIYHERYLSLSSPKTNKELCITNSFLRKMKTNWKFGRFILA